MEEHWMEPAKLAHRYQVLRLLDLCELYMMGEVVSMTGHAGFLYLPAERFLKFLEICTVASLLELPLLLIQLQYVVADLERTVMHFPELLPEWKSFLEINPDFGPKLSEMVQKILQDKNKKRKLEEDNDGSQEEEIGVAYEAQ